MDDWAEAFRALGNHERLRLFVLLTRQKGGCCVCELVEALGLPQYQVSKHLRILRRAGLIKSVRMGRWAYYAVADSGVGREMAAFTSRVIPDAALTDAVSRLRAAVARREDGRCVVQARRPGDNDARN